MDKKVVDNKSKILTYNINDVAPYINWAYFFYAWSMNGRQKMHKRVTKEAEDMLAKMNEKYHTHAVLHCAKPTVMVMISSLRVHAYQMLRQQKAVSGKPNLCLSDFLRPLSSGIKDTLGLFATSVDAALTDDFEDDTYLRMLSQTLADRLAEATAEKMHEDIRRKYWGYAPEEQLTLRELFAEKISGDTPQP